MFRRCFNAARRRGMTLLELFCAMAAMAMVVVALAALANAVQLNYEHGESYGAITQHARVVMERMTRTVNEATTSPSFPGFLILSATDSGYQFPDTLVVWHPSGTPANPTGLPLYGELMVYSWDVNNPNQLLEITNPSDTRTVPAVTDQTDWASNILAMKQSTTATKVVLTNLLRTASVTSGSTLRGVVRFASRSYPTNTEWSNYQAGTATWPSLSWTQGVYGSLTGLSQAWARIEIQLTPTTTTAASNSAALVPTPFFGSAAVYYSLHK
jgi:hypothetical protein